MQKINFELTFDNYITNNIFAKVAVMKALKEIGKTFNPLYIYGNNEKEKTHIIHASVNYIVNNLNKRIVFVSSDEFIKDCDNSKILDDKYIDSDVLIFENIEKLENLSNVQANFIYLFNHLYDMHKQMIITSKKEINDLVVDVKLKAKLGKGLPLYIKKY